MPENSKIIIKRDKQYADSIRNYKIFLDGEKIYTISNGEEKEFQIGPGKHSIQLKIDWCKSNQIEFEIKDNQKLNFLCGSNLKGLNIFLSLLYATIWRKKYLYIKLEN